VLQMVAPTINYKLSIHNYKSYLCTLKNKASGLLLPAKSIQNEY
jgi:hypothetical protein